VSTPAAALFVLLCAGWVGLETWLVGREGAGLFAPTDRASALAIIAAVGLAGTITMACALLGLGTIPGEGIRRLALMAGGPAFRIWALRTLRRLFTAVVRTQAGQRVVRAGPYRYLRHPSYTGTFCTLIGFGFALGSWPGAILMPALPLPAYLYRIHVEEHVCCPCSARIMPHICAVPGAWCLVSGSLRRHGPATPAI
jgi:protein-S-isoprenylcysteine O-methyltransferase